MKWKEKREKQKHSSNAMDDICAKVAFIAHSRSSIWLNRRTVRNSKKNRRREEPREKR